MSKTDELEDKVSRLAKRHNIRHYSFAIIRNFEIEKTLTSSDQVNKRTKFQAASLSKTVTAVVSLKLVERKLFKLNDIRQLLSHSAGISVPGFDGYGLDQKIPSLSQIFEGIPPANSSKIFQKYKPGKYRYSGGGYLVLQKIIENVTRKSFSDVANDLIFKPLGMEQSTFELISVNGNDHLYPESAAAGLWTTPSDLARLLTGIGKSLKGKSKLLSKKSAQAMLTEYLPGVGLGTFIQKTKNRIQFTHDGANFGYRARYILFSDGNGVVVMVKSNNFKFIDKLVYVVGEEYEWGKFKVKM